MGRELRKVIPNWEHPKKDDGTYHPMFDRGYLEHLDDWIENHFNWENGDDPDREESGCRFYAEWNGDAPDVEYYRPDWKESDMTWYQLYETVSEGTPGSPPFETKEELCKYLVDNGDFWDYSWTEEQAKGVVMDEGYCPSMVVSDGNVMSGQEFAASKNK